MKELFEKHMNASMVTEGDAELEERKALLSEMQSFYDVAKGLKELERDVNRIAEKAKGKKKKKEYYKYADHVLECKKRVYEYIDRIEGELKGDGDVYKDAFFKFKGF